MALWKEQNQTNTKPASSPATALPPEPVRMNEINSAPASIAPAPAAVPARATTREVKESLIASDLTIEGKIQGTGHVRIAGQFKGDVNVEGDLTIEKGAKLTGGVRASKVTIAGELEGNIEAAQRVELLESGVLTGDLKAGSLTVAAGSRMRGQAEFGWDEKPVAKSGSHSENGSGA
jgi:cytoskeletal protein CcmA (bactofilin family)